MTLCICCDDVKRNNPLIIALGDNENYIANDMTTILRFTKNFIILDDGNLTK